MKQLVVVCMILVGGAPAFAQQGQKALAVRKLAPSITQQAALVNVTVDRKPRIYTVGERFRATVKSHIAGYLYVLYVHVDDSVNVLLPNAKERNHFIRAGQSIDVPNPKSFDILVEPPLGHGFFKAIVTDKPLPPIDVTSLGPDELMLTLDLADLRVLEREVNAKGAGIRFGSSLDNRPRLLAEHSVSIQTISANRSGEVKRVPRSRQRLVLAVGVGKQQAEELEDLPACANEAREFAELMKAQFEASHVEVLTDQNVTPASVERVLRKLSLLSRSGDELIFYWSGHGGQVPDSEGLSDEADGIDEYFVTYKTNMSSFDTQRATSVTDDQLGRWLQNFSGCEILCIFDTCFSGGQAANEKAVPRKGLLQAKTAWSSERLLAKGAPDTFEHDFDTFAKDIGSRQAMVICAAKAGQEAFMRRDKDYSVLTYHLLEFLRRHDRGSFSVNEMFEAIAPQTIAYVSRIRGPLQHPVIIGKTTSGIRF